MNTGSFYKFPKDLMKAEGFIGNDGEVIQLTALYKFVYVYMLSRNEFFLKDSGKHYETQKTIAAAVMSDYHMIGKVMKVLMNHGVVEGVKLRPNGVGQWRWFYNKVNDMNLVFKQVVDSEGCVVDNTDLPDIF